MMRISRFLLWILAAHGAAAQAQQWTPMAIPNPASLTAGSGENPVLLATQLVPDKAVRSTDGGATWSAIDVAGARPVAFLASPGDPNVFYALIGSTALAVTPPPRALYRSNDAGKTWQQVTPSIATGDGAVIGNLAVGAAPDLIYGSRLVPAQCFTGSCTFAGAEGYVSSDGGRTWRKSDPPNGSTSYTVHTAFPSPSDARVAYATTRQGLFRTGDGGGTWQLVRESGGIYERQVLVDRVDPSTVYVRFDGGTQLWVTEDGGRSWRTTEPLNVVGGSSKYLLADPLQAGRLYFMGIGGEVFESRDRARTWQRVAHAAGASTTVSGSPPMVGIENGRRVIYAMSGAGPKRVTLSDGALVLHTDLWWNPAQSGWGLSLTHHASGQLFGVWFTYDAQGDPTWRVMPGGTWTDARTFTAKVYATRGPAYFAGGFDPARVTVSPVGEATLRFDDDNNAVFRYRLDDGASSETRVTRQLFGPPSDAGLINYADLWWNASESGWGIAVAQQFAYAFAVWFVYDDAGRPTWLVMPNAIYGGRFAGGDFIYGFHGDLLSMKGPPSTGPFDPSRVVGANVGQLTFRADNFHLDAATLIAAMAGRVQSRELTRQPF